MSIASSRRILGRFGMLGLALALSAPTAVSAGWPRRARNRPAQVVVTTTRTINTRQVAGLAPSPMLGSFYPDPSPINIRGNFEAGGGYSPLGTYGDTAANLIGPLSDFRTMTAPVLVYERGYDGSYRPGLGTGFSNPNFPAASPVVYPTRANVRNGPQRMSTPPQWDRAINWIDLN
jgi:hypothetical protein